MTMHGRESLFLLLAALLHHPLSAQEAPPRYPCTVTRIVDGDTIYCRQDQDTLKVRLLGIDAPEMNQGRYGKRARAALARLLPLRRDVWLDLDVQDRDVYGRLLAFIWTRDDLLVNEEMLREGFAVVYVRPPNVKYEDVLREAAAEAQRDKRGLWATPAFDCPPGEFRRRLCD